MQKKILIQLFLLVIILILSIFFFNFYFSNKANNKTANIENLQAIDVIEKKATSDKKKYNVMEEIEYNSLDKDGNQYLIKARKGEIKKNQLNLIVMEDVLAIINVKNSSPITVQSDYAIYNNLNYDTNFYGNVLIEYTDNSIASDNLDLYFKNNMATVSNNIIYKNLNTTLLADKVEIDLISKNSKIFMNNTTKKIKIMSVE